MTAVPHRGIRVRSRRLRTQIRAVRDHLRWRVDTSALDDVDPYAEWLDLGGEA